MRTAPLIAMLTLVALLASTVGVAACGGKDGSSSSSTSTTTTHKHKSKPAY